MSNHHQASAVYRSLPAALLLAVGTLVPSVAEAANIIGSQVAGTHTYPAYARIVVDTPVPGTYSGNLNQPFVFNGTNTYEFIVTGQIKIRQETPANSIDDPFELPMSAPPGLKAIQQEIVDLTGASVVSPPGAQAQSVSLGDGVDDGANTGPQVGDLRSYFSTGGAVENGPDGSTAAAFLNLFMDINLVQPQINTGLLSQLGFQQFYNIGQLYNDTKLHLEATIGAYQPFGVPFLMTGGPVSLFMPSSHPLVQDLFTIGGRIVAPLEAARFVEAEIFIVPEPSGVLLAVTGVSAIACLRRRDTAGKPRR